MSSQAHASKHDEPAAVSDGHESKAPGCATPSPNAVPQGSRRLDFAEFLRGVLARHAANVAISLAALLVGLVFWHVATHTKLNVYINFENVPPPLRVGEAFMVHLADPEFYIHIAVSMRRILTGYLLATALGVITGVLMARSRVARAFVYPYIEILRPIPAVAWIPLAILMWPSEESSIVYITFLGALFPIVLNTLHGVEQTPEVLVRAAKSLGASRLQIFWHVILPAALPSIAAGLAIGMGVSWFSLLAGEIISGQYGIGYFTWNAYSLINYPDIVVGMLVIGGLGTLSTYAVKLAMQPFLAWQRRAR
ncbi:ABC transporter permease [Allomesorhizobium alhagi]|jgi:NitT/TauT family transport system permease protein|uniref:Binding-protein dependent transport system inner membrane protein n=1 Tax=Mesorhizobium alhagi CCNWXJ12-2 TaxID=1107882 RepID=H0I1S7_9HYPH|nr:ABC transporter permease [Mesorhizobium alhagi]EHK53067.1 binding-protein dependent transport system inner membrane protein [Mesorhizobium alhagi CCNWXJ12-2]